MVEALIWTTAVFFIGGSILLERRCLGQVAVAHPLVTCTIAGVMTGEYEAAVWLGMSLQLLSVGQGHSADWALAGFVGAVSCVYAHFHGLELLPGGPRTIAIASVATTSAIGASFFERAFSHKDARASTIQSPLLTGQLRHSCAKIVHRRLLRGFVLGGVQSVMAFALAFAAAVAFTAVADPSAVAMAVAAIAVPSIGVAVALGSLSGYRFIGYGAAGSAAMVVFFAFTWGG